MQDKQVLSEVLLKQLLELLDKQPKKDAKQTATLLNNWLAEIELTHHIVRLIC